MNKLELPQIERDVDLDNIAEKIENVTQKSIVSVAPQKIKLTTGNLSGPKNLINLNGD